ncbi:uncharacterized protein CLUP02_13561 [Colletotrichum lupini]|uniref:Uncharacterized protein n=1 Tax=Colletotrichum lupini TaxID=145971 RepID=A0A9Q8T2K5_9PEZI|nr:uncharacterized protein CLUP02_13561 [Colletotrichum lupini]UQC88039.1 hypothetical protein CLUP02_13561 [Colletotrichum lupini]
MKHWLGSPWGRTLQPLAGENRANLDLTSGPATILFSLRFARGSLRTSVGQLAGAVLHSDHDQRLQKLSRLLSCAYTVPYCDSIHTPSARWLGERQPTTVRHAQLDFLGVLGSNFEDEANATFEDNNAASLSAEQYEEYFMPPGLPRLENTWIRNPPCPLCRSSEVQVRAKTMFEHLQLLFTNNEPTEYFRLVTEHYPRWSAIATHQKKRFKDSLRGAIVAPSSPPQFNFSDKQDQARFKLTVVCARCPPRCVPISSPTGTPRSTWVHPNGSDIWNPHIAPINTPAPSRHHRAVQPMPRHRGRTGWASPPVVLSLTFALQPVPTFGTTRMKATIPLLLLIKTECYLALLIHSRSAL